MTERVPGYTRLSKREQTEGTHTLEQHISRLKAAGATEIYYDIASRSKSDRKGLNQVMELIASKKVSKAIFIRIDRMTDSPTVLERAINICLESNARIIGIDDAIDFHTVGGRTHARILVTLARAEVERLSERCKAGWDYLRQREIVVNVPFGYFKLFDKPALDHRPVLFLPDQGLELSPCTLARDTIDLFFEGKSLRKAVQLFHEKYEISKSNHHEQKTGFVTRSELQWSPSGLKLWLVNPVLRGHLAYLRDTSKPVIIYNTHPDHRLIGDEEFREIEQILEHNRSVRGWGFRGARYPLSGLVACAECGASCYSMTSGRRVSNGAKRDYYYYQCKNYQHRACTAKKTIRMDVAEASVINALILRAQAITEYASTPLPEQTESPQLQQLRVTLLSLEQLGQNPAIEAAKNDVRQQIKAELAKSQQQEVIDASMHELLLKTFTDPEYWQQLGDADKRQIYRDLVGRVIVRDGQVEKVELRV